MSTTPHTDEPKFRGRNYHKIVRALASDGQIEKVAALVEQESLRVKEEYLARLKIKADDSDAEAEAVRKAFVKRELPRYQKLATKDETRQKDDWRADRKRDIDKIEAGLLKALRNLRTAVEAYASKSGSESLSATARAMSEMINRLNEPSVPVQEFVVVAGRTIEITALAGGNPVVERMAWGAVTHLGTRRAAYVSIEVGDDARESDAEAFARAMRGVVGAVVTGESEDGRTRVEDWLHDADIAVIDADDLEKLQEASQHLSACRGALLCAYAVAEMLAFERRALEHRLIVLDQRSNALAQTKPVAPDVFLKRIDDLCRGELERFLDYAAREIDAAKEGIAKTIREGASKQIASMKALTLVSNGAAPARPGREVFSVQPARITAVADLAKQDLSNRCTDLCKDAAELWHGGDGRGRLVDGVVRPVLAENDIVDRRTVDALARERFFTPLTPVTTGSLLDKHFSKLTQTGSPALVRNELPKDSRSVGILVDKIGRMPSQLMAPFAGFFVLTSMLGLGSVRSWIKQGAETTAGQASQGSAFGSTLWLLAMLGLLLVVFGFASHFMLRREREAAEAVAIEKSRDGVSAAVMQTVEAFATEWLSVFRPNTLSSLKDLMRRAGKDLTVFYAEQHARWSGHAVALKQERAAVAAQLASVESLIRAGNDTRAAVDTMERDLRKLLAKWEKEDEKAGRKAGGEA